MKVLMVSGIFPPRIGGPATQVWHLCQVLSSAGVETLVVTFGPSGGHEMIDGVSVYRFPLAGGRAGRGPEILRFCRAFSKLLSRERPDLIHCHDTHLRSLLAGWLARRRGVPAVVKYAGDFVWEHVNARGLRVRTLADAYRAGVGARLIAMLQRWGLRQFTLVQAASEFRKAMLTGTVRVPDRCVRIVPNFIRLPVVEGAPAPRGQEVTAITTGRFAPHKRTEWLIEAFARLERPATRLRVVGGGDSAEVAPVARAIRTSPASDRITRHDRVPYAELVRLLGDADLFVSASVEEGFGISFVEAMACGLPVLASAATAVPEVVPDGEAGFLVAPDDQAAFVERWRTLVDDCTLRARMGQFARKHARKYDLAENIGAFVSLYRETVAVAAGGAC